LVETGDADMTRAQVRVTVAALAAVLTSLAGVALTASSAQARHHHHHHHGREGRIAFVRGGQIYTVRSDGTGVHRLTASGMNSHPKWSPNGRRIAFVHESPAGATDVWVMSAWGSFKTQVTHVGNATEPTWSPSGRYLAFGGGDSGALEKIRSTYPFGQPTELMAFETNDGCGVDEEPADAHPLSVDRFVAWSRDGSRIAVFNHDDCQLDDDIFMYYPATGEAREYAAVGGACCGEADWSDLAWGPGGKFGYASVDYLGLPSDPQPSRIVYPGYSGRPGDAGPAPDPAGVRIAVSNASSGRSRIFVQAVDGAHRKFLTCGEQPDWQRVA
jgi:Tol biopolymer transport system component